MREKSIIFSAQEVMDALAGLKIKKRIPFKHQPPSDEHVLATYLSATRDGRDTAKHRWVTVDGLRLIDRKQPYFSCPYQKGGTVWVKEAYGNPEIIVYRADGMTCSFGRADYLVTGWHPAAQMPRWASRITMNVVSVGFEKWNPAVWVVELEVDSIKGRCKH